jgi:hypothetical protein
MTASDTRHSARQKCVKAPLMNMADLTNELADAWSILLVDTYVADYMNRQERLGGGLAMAQRQNY